MATAQRCNGRNVSTWRTGQTLAAKTLNDYLAAVFAFFSWLEKAEQVERNPLKKRWQG